MHCVFNGSFLGCINSEITKSEFRFRFVALSFRDEVDFLCRFVALNFRDEVDFLCRFVALNFRDEVGHDAILSWFEIRLLSLLHVRRSSSYSCAPFIISQ